MRQLESLLQNISATEREEALQYYNEYFNDAGPENEQNVIEALGNPAKVAENIKKDIFGNGYGENIYQKINAMLENNDFSQLDEILQMRDKLFDTLAAAIKSQIKRVKAKASTTRSSILYLTIINETKTMVLQTRNLLKSQRYFISGD